MLPSVRLTDIIPSRPKAVHTLRLAIQRTGYARVVIDKSNSWDGINAGLDEASALHGFRFPPIDVENGDRGVDDSDNRVQYNTARRACFQSLFDVATVSFAALASGTDLPLNLKDAVNKIDEITGRCSVDEKSGHLIHGLKLFGSNSDRHEPFEHPDRDPFGQTFFNLFNYSYGMLNPHKDRGLLTVIASRQARLVQDGEETNDITSRGKVRDANARQSALWVHSPPPLDSDQDNAGNVESSRWLNVDNMMETDNEVAILLGEDSEQLQLARMYNLKAAKHAVRVDPVGEYVAHSHFRPDPEQQQLRGTDGHNRVSAALILRHDF